jgi:transcription-repair coupling factor (superfamily II helicase)
MFWLCIPSLKLVWIFHNVNTIIIDDALQFGLAQFFQLRGRVGRSDRRAYAYLLYPSQAIVN